MKKLLSRHYLPENRPAAGVLAFGIQSPDGARVADGIWAPYGRHLGLEGYEIKVSRADVLAELADRAKADHWLRYCARWWLFVSDPSFVDGLDIPEQWGVAAPPSGRRTRSLTVVRPAPKLHPIDTGAAWQRVHAWYAFKHADRTKAHAREVEDLNQRIDRLNERVAAGQRTLSPHSIEMGKLHARITRRLSGAGVHSFNIADGEIEDAVFGAIVDHLAASAYAANRVRQAEQVLRDLERTLAAQRSVFDPVPLRKLIADLKTRTPDAEELDLEATA